MFSLYHIVSIHIFYKKPFETNQYLSEIGIERLEKIILSLPANQHIKAELDVLIDR